MSATSVNNAAALVLGGSRGMGAAIVRRLARDGRPVAFTYAQSRTSADELVEEIAAQDGVAIAIKADSADATEIEAAVNAAAARFGKLGVLVVNAGILMGGTIDTFTMANFDRMLAVNVRGVFAGIHFAAPHLLDGARIITIGSNTAGYVGRPGGGVYAMTKAAVAQLVRAAARDFAPRQITVNNVQPGPIATDMTSAMMDYIRPRLPLGRIGEADEVGGLVSWLAGPEAGYVSGASLTIDGGWSA